MKPYFLDMITLVTITYPNSLCYYEGGQLRMQANESSSVACVQAQLGYMWNS